jgi:hypothetical protein
MIGVREVDDDGGLGEAVADLDGFAGRDVIHGYAHNSTK